MDRFTDRFTDCFTDRFTQPKTAVTKQKTDYQSQISAYGTLKSSLATFQTAVSALTNASKFNAQTVTSGNASAFTATSNGSATIGDYAITVSQLAKSQKPIANCKRN